MKTFPQSLAQFARLHAIGFQCLRARFLFVPLCLACATQLAFAQPAPIAANVPVRELTIREKSPQVFANIFQVREIANQQVPPTRGFSVRYQGRST